MTEQLLAVARCFCSARSLSLSRVSTVVFNDGKKLTAIEEKGADLSTGKFEFAMQWFSDHWPEGLGWPVGVQRPEASSQAPAA